MDSLLLGSFKGPSLLANGSYVRDSSASRLREWSIPEGQCTAGFQPSLSKHCIKGIRETSRFYQKQNKRFLVNATAGHPLESEPGAYSRKNFWNSPKDTFDAFYRFSRPHTVIGTVNKPYLPLASGEYSVRTGTLIVASFAVLVPLLRWKRFALVAAMCIVAVRAVIVQLAFFLHVQWPPVTSNVISIAIILLLHRSWGQKDVYRTHVYKRPAVFSRPLIFATAFMSFFSVVIALFKDIPDIDGDMIYGIRSFSVRLGQKRVFWICISLLEIAYCVALLVGASSGFLWSKVATVMFEILVSVGTSALFSVPAH
ncbi:hypothetical protein TIFTF001_021170 [Ficus carica]|uniref:Uncharacterized protein n=1 Tax=Ficus carica TaxID=3494 RepID=A0AA88AH07_FICCA|nr:hypothetical protein TIFTF001_021170 [Ficus carica]